MNTRILIAVVVSMFVCQQVHDQVEPVMPETTELEGTWEVVSYVEYGVSIEGAHYFWRIEGNRRYTRRGANGNWQLLGTFSVDPSTMPA